MPPFRVENGVFGKKLTLTDRWTEECLEACQQLGIVELELVSTFGWSAKNLDFLSHPHLNQILALRVSDFGRTSGQEPLEDDRCATSLRALRHINIQTHCKNKLDFSRLNDLRECVFQWRQKNSPLDFSSSLSKLTLMRYRAPDLEGLSKLRGLRSLSISGCPAHALKGIEQLNRLEIVDLGLFTKLTTIDELASFANLRYLHIGSCKHLHQLDALSSTNLVRLDLIDDGHIASLKPIADVKSLEVLFFYGETVIDDGDIAVLEQLPRLKSVRFGNRRKYNRTLESLCEWIATREDPKR